MSMRKHLVAFIRVLSPGESPPTVENAYNATIQTASVGDYTFTVGEGNMANPQYIAEVMPAAGSLRIPSTPTIRRVQFRGPTGDLADPSSFWVAWYRMDGGSF